jgi:alkylation response protein AidB-like acyl-CoA dehydrogenase
MAAEIVAEFDARLASRERELIEQARAFGQQVVEPAAQQWERDRRHPTEVLRRACQEGLAAIELPTALGGHGCRFSTTLRVVEELARFDFAFAFSLVNHHNAMVRVARAAPALAERLVPRMLSGKVIGATALTEPNHGSDLAVLTTTACPAGDEWLLEGEKAWVTNGAVAGAIVSLAQTEPGSRWRGLATFLIEADRAGFVRQGAYELSGGSAIGVAGFKLANYRAPAEALLEPPGAGFRAALKGINRARAYVAAMCAGMLDAALDHAVRYASRRTAFGRPVIEFQGLQWSLVDADTDLAALRLLAYRAAQQIDGGEDAEVSAAQAKKLAGSRVLGHLAACVQAMGANGLRADHPLMRHLSACKIAAFTDCTTEIMNERLGKLMCAAARGNNAVD